MALSDFLSGIQVDELSPFLSGIQVDDLSPYDIIPIPFDLQEELQEKYYIQTRPGAQEVGITVGKIHGQCKTLLPHPKQEKEAKI